MRSENCADFIYSKILHSLVYLKPPALPAAQTSSSNPSEEFIFSALAWIWKNCCWFSLDFLPRGHTSSLDSEQQRYPSFISINPGAIPAGELSPQSPLVLKFVLVMSLLQELLLGSIRGWQDLIPEKTNHALG
ncbi:hypothetical protein BTVI_20746 [Pitangus sulphuratus]|nr:hypothetical protein BTVI_20746 [Pitangus sulphuratus]